MVNGLNYEYSYKLYIVIEKYSLKVLDTHCLILIVIPICAKNSTLRLAKLMTMV